MTVSNLTTNIEEYYTNDSLRESKMVVTLAIHDGYYVVKKQFVPKTGTSLTLFQTPYIRERHLAYEMFIKLKSTLRKD